jgi:GAF domain-containing protein
MPKYDQLIVECLSKIDDAGRKILELDSVLQNICKTVQCLGFDFVWLQLKNEEEHIIETRYGVGSRPEWFGLGWSGLAKHTILGEPALWDIQAHIVMHDPPRIEIIAGHDRRFDDYIFKKFKHKDLVRMFGPIILAPEEVNLESLRWDVLKEIYPNVDRPSGDDRRTVLEVCPQGLVAADGQWLQVIGTIEAGFYDSSREISPELALQTATMAGQRAGDLYRASLENVFKTIAQGARNIIGSEAASLHFAWDDTSTELSRFIYEAQDGRHFPSVRRLRSNGLGQRALQERQALWVPNKDLGHDEQYLREFYPQAYKDGMKAEAAIPIFFQGEGEDLYNDDSRDGHSPEKQGLLYVMFEKPHWFTKDEITCLEVLRDRATEAIREATYYTKEHDRARRVTVTNHIVRLLADNPESPFLLEEIAGVTLNLLAADVVSVYEYDAQKKKFLSDRPTIAGRLTEPDLIIEPDPTSLAVDDRSTPALLLKTRENLYEVDATSNPILAAKRDSDQFPKSFVARERVKSAAGLILRGETLVESGEEIFGLMFVNYRRRHRFTYQDRQFAETLASIAAIAIRNRRFKKAIQGVLDEIRDRLLEICAREPEPEAVLRNVLSELHKIVPFDIATYYEHAAISGDDLGDRHPESSSTIRRIRFAFDPQRRGFQWQMRWLSVPKVIEAWIRQPRAIITDVQTFIERQPPETAEYLRKHASTQMAMQESIRSFLYFPLRSGNDIVSGISFGARTPRRFDESHWEKLNAVGLAQVLGFVRRAHRQRSEDFSRRLANLFQSHTAPAQLASDLVREIAEEFRWDYVGIFRAARVLGNFQLVAQHDNSGKLTTDNSFQQPIDRGVLGATLRCGRSIRILDVDTEEGVRFDYIQRGVYRSCMCLPIEVASNIEWILDCESTQQAAFAKPDQDALEDLIRNLQTTLGLWFEMRVSGALLEHTSQGVVLTGANNRIERMNAKALQLFGLLELGTEERQLGSFGADAFSSDVLSRKQAVSNVQLRILGGDKVERRVLGSSALSDEAFNRWIWLFTDSAEREWIANIGYARATVEQVAAQARGPLMLAIALIKRLNSMVAESGTSSAVSEQLLTRILRTLSKADLTYERLVQAMALRQQIGVDRLLEAFETGLSAEKRKALKLIRPTQPVDVRGTPDSLSRSLVDVFGHLYMSRQPNSLIICSTAQNQSHVAIAFEAELTESTSGLQPIDTQGQEDALLKRWLVALIARFSALLGLRQQPVTDTLLQVEAFAAALPKLGQKLGRDQPAIYRARWDLLDEGGDLTETELPNGRHQVEIRLMRAIGSERDSR